MPPPKKKWFKRWYFLLPFVIVTLSILSFVGLVAYYLVYPDCSRPLTYKLGSIDPQFELSNEKILDELEEAEGIWESFKKSDLFEYSESTTNPDIIIDFVFDQRQKELETNQTINNEVTVYNKELNAYEDKVTKHEIRLSGYEKEAKQYEIDAEKHNEAMEVWDKGKQTDETEWKRLDKEYTRLTNLDEYLKGESISIDASVNNLNGIKTNLDKKKESLDESSKEQISSNLPLENGIWDPETNKITIYRFLDDRELKWLLAHELGHALGLGHVEYPKSVMYHEISNTPILSLSNDDVRELSRICLD